MWPRRNPDLIVPIRDRRQRRRILTLKNFRNAMIVLIVVFVIISIRSEMRGRGVGTDYGRLVNRDLPPAEEIARKPIETVQEKEVDETPSADPFDLKSAAREQYLGVTQTASVPLLEPVQPPPAPVRVGAEADMVIVGDSNGVAVVPTKRAEKPQLGGGFGRP